MCHKKSSASGLDASAILYKNRAQYYVRKSLEIIQLKPIFGLWGMHSVMPEVCTVTPVHTPRNNITGRRQENVLNIYHFC